MSINVDDKSSKSKSDFKSKPSNENQQKKSQFNFKPKKIKYNQQGQNSNFSQNQQNQNNFCHICNKNGHSTDRCYFNMKNNKEKSKQNDKKSSRAFVTSSSDADEIALPTNTKNLNNDSILFDNQASSSIFKNPNLLQNLRETPPKKFFGINDEVAPLVSTQAGLFGDFGLIPFHHNATANVISWSEAIDRGMQVRYDHVKDRILVTSPAGWRYIFSRSNGLYVANFRERERVSVTTVEGNETLYTAKQKLGAAKAMKFVRSLGFPPFNVVLDAIRHNTIRNIPIDEKDLICAKEIYGKELGTVMGKTTAPSPPTVRTDSVSYEVDRVLRLHVDLLFVNSHNFFSVCVRTLRSIYVFLSRCWKRFKDKIKNSMCSEISCFILQKQTVRCTRNNFRQRTWHDRIRRRYCSTWCLSLPSWPKHSRTSCRAKDSYS